jgi:ubiquitin carboxyl-terminal hydrolase 47
MTKEFRENILALEYNSNFHGKIEDCIPFQLQKLFARLQLKFRESESTEDLTKSFDWGYSQLVEQHDIQELCIVLFEAITNSLQTEENFINEYFFGLSISVVKCLECSYESTKTNKFLDISLAIRNPWEKIYNRTLDEALINFLKKEKLTGADQYKCSRCDKKVDAEKYLRFSNFPKILIFALNRFEYDINIDGRKKVNDRLEFPDELDMSNYLSKDSMKNNQDFLYDLYAIVVHSGSARGGHYSSFIKSFEDSKWYKFDDSFVREAHFEEITSTFGNDCFDGNLVNDYSKFF